jgi:hypothetical protein
VLATSGLKHSGSNVVRTYHNNDSCICMSVLVSILLQRVRLLATAGPNHSGSNVVCNCFDMLVLHGCACVCPAAVCEAAGGCWCKPGSDAAGRHAAHASGEPATA